MKVYFFVGKGGTGKTTLSAAFGLGISKNNYKTLVISLDPAHNLGDALNLKISDRVLKISKNFYAVEINIEKTIRKYLSELSNRMRSTFRYFSALNIDRYFDILKNAPGMEEYAIVEVIKSYINSKEYDVIVFDTPPTGITLRILGIPEVSIVWTERLIELRRKILSRRKMLNNIHFASSSLKKRYSEENDDPVMRELYDYKGEMIELRDFLSSDNCTVNIVTVPENIALFETERILEFLKKFSIKPGKVFINRCMMFRNVPKELIEKMKEQKRVVDKLRKDFSGLTVKEIPLVKISPQGLDRLFKFYENYLKEVQDD